MPDRPGTGNQTRSSDLLYDGDTSSQKRKLQVKFHFVKREYLNDVGANKAKTTYKSFQAALNRYGRFLASEGQPDPGCEFALAFETVQQYKFSLMKSGVKKKGGLLGQTVRAQLCPLSGMCSYMIRMRIMDPHENPFEKMELPDRKTAVRLLVSDEEVAGLLNGSERQADPKRVAFSRLLVSALVHTGVRAEELSNIEIGHISLEQETLEVRYGKGSKNRILNPPREFFIALEGWLPFRDPDRLYCEGLARIRGVGPHARISPRRGHWPSHAPVPAHPPSGPEGQRRCRPRRVRRSGGQRPE